MVFARNSKAASRLSEQICDHKMQKTYYAICKGCPKDKSGILVNYLKKDEKENIVKIVTMGSVDAKKAELEYKVLQTIGDESFLEIKIITGRSHQIRVQLAGINCPLVGDNKYGKDKTRASRNLGLWAGKLEFTHPVSKEKLTFMAMPDTSKSPWKDFYLDKYFIR